LLLIALTFMYVSARSVTDDEFKSSFRDPLIADLRATLVARNRYDRKESTRNDPTNRPSGQSAPRDTPRRRSRRRIL
jgi:hypothetical protein